jgi:hypothetical protein
MVGQHGNAWNSIGKTSPFIGRSATSLRNRCDSFLARQRRVAECSRFTLLERRKSQKKKPEDSVDDGGTEHGLPQNGTVAQSTPNEKMFHNQAGNADKTDYRGTPIATLYPDRNNNPSLCFEKGPEYPDPLTSSPDASFFALPSPNEMDDISYDMDSFILEQEYGSPFTEPIMERYESTCDTDVLRNPLLENTSHSNVNSTLNIPGSPNSLASLNFGCRSRLATKAFPGESLTGLSTVDLLDVFGPEYQSISACTSDSLQDDGVLFKTRYTDESLAQNNHCTSDGSARYDYFSPVSIDQAPPSTEPEVLQQTLTASVDPVIINKDHSAVVTEGITVLHLYDASPSTISKLIEILLSENTKVTIQKS